MCASCPADMAVPVGTSLPTEGGRRIRISNLDLEGSWFRFTREFHNSILYFDPALADSRHSQTPDTDTERGGLVRKRAIVPFSTIFSGRKNRSSSGHRAEKWRKIFIEFHLMALDAGPFADLDPKFLG